MIRNSEMDQEELIKDVEETGQDGRRKKFTMHGVRYVFATMGCLGFCMTYILRANLNVAIVRMVNNSMSFHNVSGSTNDECPNDGLNATNISDDAQSHNEEGEFHWSSNMQGLVLGSVYYGYATSQILGGRLAEVFGGKMVFGIAVLSTAVLSLVTPVAARCDVSLVIIIRILEGIGQGMTLPAMHSMLARWAPDSEKSVLVNIVHNGIDIGTVISMSATGLLCGSDFLGGWPSTFYVFGMIGCLWYIAWHFLVTDSPASHPCITESELNYIVKDQNMKPNEQLSSVPWIKILKSVPFWALVATQFAQDWNFYILLNDLPTFMANILHFRIEEDGVLSALPHLSELIIRSIVSVSSDSVIRRGWVSVGTSRKFCNTLGCLSSAIGLTVICFIGCDVKSTVAVFVLSNGIAGFSGSGYVLNHLDLSPEYAGTLMGLAGTIANLTGFIAPAVVGAFTENAQTRHQWSLVFAITITLLLVSTAIFAIFGSAEKQEWTKDEEPNTKS